MFNRKISWANIATILFGALCLLDWIFKIQITRDQDIVLNLAVAFVFMNSIHIIFPIWLMQRSDDYRQLLEINLAKRAIVKIGLAIVFVLFFLTTLIIYFYMDPSVAIGFNLFFVVWSSWHYLSQTRGLYSTIYISEKKQLSVKVELRFLKYMVLLIFLARATRLYNLTYPGEQFRILQLIGTSFYILATGLFIILISMIWLRANTFRNTQVWVVSRFLLWLGTAVTPLSAYAVTAVHGSEYFDLARRVENNSLRLTPSRAFSAGFLVILCSFIAIDTLYLTQSLTKMPTFHTVVMCSGFSLSMTHYLLDTYIYRTQNEKSRLIMSRFSETTELAKI